MVGWQHIVLSTQHITNQQLPAAQRRTCEDNKETKNCASALIGAFNHKHQVIATHSYTYKERHRAGAVRAEWRCAPSA
jgi:hypothetical protein